MDEYIYTLKIARPRSSMSKILFYGPFNQRSRDTESLMIAFVKQGHRVTCLSQQEGYLINDFLNANGVSAQSHIVSGKRTGWLYYFHHLIFFVRFCRKHKVEVVYSHLEPANFVASIGQYFIGGRTYLCRHHIDEGLLYQFDKDYYYRVTYRLARKIIVVSRHARKYMIEREHIPEKKIIHINLAYDFSFYNEPDLDKIRSIRENFNADILLLAACRLTEFKRPELAIQVAKALSDLGLNVKLVLLGKGEMQASLAKLIATLGLEDKVFMPGYVDNVLEYMAAADFFLHPSVLDSSCVAIKEVGLVEKAVIVCKSVGDFEDYIIDGKNGFSVDRDKFVEASTAVVLQNWRNKDRIKEMGQALKRSIIENFSIERVIGEYDSLNTSI